MDTTMVREKKTAKTVAQRRSEFIALSPMWSGEEFIQKLDSLVTQAVVEERERIKEEVGEIHLPVTNFESFASPKIEVATLVKQVAKFMSDQFLYLLYPKEQNK